MEKSWLGGWIVWVYVAITAYYAVVFGQAMRYFVFGLQGTFKAGIDSQALWDTFNADPRQTILFLVLVIFLMWVVLYRGIKGGLELVGKIAMPLLFVCLLITSIWANTQRGAAVGLRFLFVPEWKYLLDSKVWLNALTQAAWSAGAGWGMMLTYANYFKKTRISSSTTL